MLGPLTIALSLAILAGSSPLNARFDDFSVKHAWVEVPAGWVSTGPAPADHLLDMRIGLKQARLDELISSLYEVSNPTHHRYGQHLSKEEVSELVAPHDDTVDLVDAWLAAHGVDVYAVDRLGAGEWLSLTLSVTQAEKMLGTNYEVYDNAQTGESIVRTTSYSLPTILHPHVDVVTPTTHFSNMRRMKATSHRSSNTVIEPVPTSLTFDRNGVAAVPASCARTITPTCLRALYNTTGFTPTGELSTLGITGYLEEFANFADLQTFFKDLFPAGEGSNFTVVEVNGGLNTQSEPGVEANLDVQYSSSIAFPIPLTFFSTGGSPPFIPDSATPSNTNEPYLDWLDFIIAQDSLPQTFSTSYGDDEQTVPLDFATSVCNLFAQLGARGSSVLFSSGDDGVGSGTCATNNGSNTVVFQPNFPASCPYVTTVGATTGISPEVAADFSAGGFSNYFGQPSYQTTAVEGFLTALGATDGGLFNVSGRAYPDVSAQGENFEIVVGGERELVDGTSCSSPTFAGVVALLNDFRISIGKSPLGFLNPLIYTNLTAGLNDITSGDNPGCGTNGFSARAGWDPVTGLGTPDFGKLQAIVADLP